MLGDQLLRRLLTPRPGDQIMSASRRDVVELHLERADGYPPHPERDEAAGIDLVSALGHRSEIHAVHAVAAW